MKRDPGASESSKEAGEVARRAHLATEVRQAFPASRHGWTFRGKSAS